MSYLSGADLLQRLYAVEQSLGGLLAPLGIQFSPLAVTGNVGAPGVYNLPALTPVTTETATYTAAGSPVTDTYTGVGHWDLLNDAGGVNVTAAKNDILSKYVVATGADGYKAVFSLGEIAPQFGAQPVLVAYADTGGQLGPGGADGATRLVLPNDHAGGRYVSNLVSLQVVDLTSFHPTLS